MPSNEISSLAEKIARLIEAETSRPDLSSVAASIEKINRRLDKIEAAIDGCRSHDSNSSNYQQRLAPTSGPLPNSEQKSNSGSTSGISNSPAAHPSQARFTLAEAVADAIIDAKTKEKACTFEPNGKPCDHCGMCSARGF